MPGIHHAVRSAVLLRVHQPLGLGRGFGGLVRRPGDHELSTIIKKWPNIGDSPITHPERLLECAEYHGLAGVIGDSLVSAGTHLPLTHLAREAARALDHDAHLAHLLLLDAALYEDGLCAVSLKGPLFGQRYYPRPSARVTGDTDLLVTEGSTSAVMRTLVRMDYRQTDNAEAPRLRSYHHHLHFRSRSAPPLELHFRAYRGFGSTMVSAPLLQRSVRVDGFRALRVLDVVDEVVYLSVHAAAHGFGRWSWLFDLRLLIETLDDERLKHVSERAAELGFARPLALTARLLDRLIGVDSQRMQLLGRLGDAEGEVMERLLSVGSGSSLSPFARLAYTTLLCATPRAGFGWASSEALRRMQEVFARGAEG